MPLALRDLDTGLFYANQGDWTPNVRLAKAFEEETEVIQAALENKIKNPEMIWLNKDREVTGGTFLRLSNNDGADKSPGTKAKEVGMGNPAEGNVPHRAG